MSFKPEQFGRYLLTERIALGGMAEIFNGKIFGAMGFEKNLVIKRILPQFAEDAEFLHMFITEAKLVCHLEHPNIVQVHELGETDGQYYIAMEMVSGVDCRQLWRTLAKRRQRLPGILALFIVGEFLKGLDFAHRAVGPDGSLLGVVHRDVSLSNILLSFRGDVKIGDFGIALVQQESKTQVGVLKGKFGYMSPEQVAGMKVDHRSDIFAAGVVLAELLLGRRLFIGQSDFDTLDKVLNVRLEVLEEHAGALPPEVVRMVRRALQREPADRYQTAQELCDDIHEFLFEKRARITSETLAAFIAEYVTPFLEPGSPGTSSSASRSASPPSRRSVSPPPSGQVSPVVAGLAEVPPRPDLPAEGIGPATPNWSRPSQEIELSLQDVNIVAEAPSVSVSLAPAEPSGPPPSSPSSDNLPGPSLGEPLSSPSSDNLPGPSLGEQAPPPRAAGAAEAPALSLSPESGIWDDGQFGAIPLYEMDEGSVSRDLDLEEIDVVERKREGGAGRQDAGGEELDLDELGEAEDDPYAVIADDPEAASILTTSQLVSVPVVVQQQVERVPAFVGQIATRTVTKVLFRFAVVSESGLLVLSREKERGRGSELQEWLHVMQARAGAVTDRTEVERRTCNIHLAAGQPHLLAADRSEEVLVVYLIQTGVITQREVERAILSHAHRKPVAALLAAGQLTTLQVSRSVTSFVRDHVLEAFSWTEGGFAFFRGSEIPSEAFPSGEDAASLIVKGVGCIDEALLDAYFGALSGKLILVNRTPPARLEWFGENPLLQEAYRAAGSVRSVDEALALCSRGGTPLAAKRAVYLLLECELLAVA